MVRWAADGQKRGVEVVLLGLGGVSRIGGEGQTVLKTMAVCCLSGLANLRRSSKKNGQRWSNKNKRTYSGNTPCGRLARPPLPRQLRTAEGAELEGEVCQSSCHGMGPDLVNLGQTAAGGGKGFRETSSTQMVTLADSGKCDHEVMGVGEKGSQPVE